MANSELLDSFADIPALTKEYETFLSYLQKLQAQFESLNKAAVSLSGSAKGKDIISSLKDAEAATNSYVNTTKKASDEFNTMLAASKQNAIDLKNKNLELSAAQKQLTLDITKAKEEARLKAISDKENAVISKQAIADEATAQKKAAADQISTAKQLAETERQAALDRRQEAADNEKQVEILLAASREKINLIKQEIAAQEELTSSISQQEIPTGFNNQRAQLAQPVTSSSEAFIPSTDLEKNIQLLQRSQSALTDNQLAQKQLKKDLDTGVISQAEYDAQINKSIQLELEHKQTIAGVSKEIKALTAADALEGTELKAKQIQLARLIEEYGLLTSAERNSVSGLAKQDAIGELNTEVLTLERTLGQAQRNVGNYAEASVTGFAKIGQAANGAFSFVRKLAYLIPGIGVAGLIGLAIDPIIDFTKNLLGLGDAADTAKREVDSVAHAIGSSTADIEKVNVLSRAILDTNNSLDERKNALNELKSINKDYFGDLVIEDGLYDKLTQKVNDYAHALILSNVQKAKGDELTKATIEEQDIRKQISDLDALISKRTQLAIARVADIKARGLSDISGKQSAIDILKDDQKQIDAIKQRTVLYDKLGEASDKVGKLSLEYEDAIKAALSVPGLDDGKGAQAQGEKLKAIKQKFFDEDLKDESAYLKEYSKLEDDGLTDRIAKRKQAAEIDTEISKQETATALQNAKDTLNAVLNAQADRKGGPDKNAISNAERQYAEDIRIINLKSAHDLTKIETDKNTDILNIQFDFNAKRAASDKQANEDFKKYLADRKAAELAAITNRSERELNGIQADSDQQAKVIIDRGNAQLIAAGSVDEKIKEAEKKTQLELLQLDIDTSKLRIQVAINTAKSLISAANPADQDKIEKLKAQIAALEKQAAELNGKQIKLDIDIRQEKIDEAVAGLNKLKNAYDTITGLISKVVDAQTTADKNRIQDQIDLLNKKTQTEIDGINASTDSAQNKADKIAVINARAAAQQAQLELQQRQADERKARYDKAAGIGEIIINTAIAVTKLLATPPLAIIAAALGAAELAIAIATPIPKYKMGTENHPGGLAIVGDGGVKEYIQHPDGSGYVTPDKPTLIDIPKYSKVFANTDNLEIARQYYSFQSKPYIPIMAAQNVNHNAKLEKQMKILTAAVIAKPTAVIKNSLGGWTTGWEAEQRHVKWVTRLMK